jgi:hypothetical protein
VKQYGLDVDGAHVVYPSVGWNGCSPGRSRGRRPIGGGRRGIVREIHAIDLTIPVFDVRTMTDRSMTLMARQRFLDHHARRVRRVCARAGGRRRTASCRIS